jgi:hypothetical protein
MHSLNYWATGINPSLWRPCWNERRASGSVFSKCSLAVAGYQATGKPSPIPEFALRLCISYTEIRETRSCSQARRNPTRVMVPQPSWPRKYCQ